MSHQPNLFSSSSANGSAAPGPEPVPSGSGHVPVWLRRLELFLYVVVRLYIGGVVLVLPWTPLWVDNHLLNYFPSASSILMSGAARGIVSGLGLLNLWIAVDEAVHARKSILR